MSIKLKHSALSKGCSLIPVSQNERITNSFSLTSHRIGRLTSLVLAFMLSTIFCTPFYGQCTLNCGDQKQISLGTNGYAVIIPELIINGDFSCAGDIQVTVFDENNQAIGDTVRCEHINKTLKVVISSTITNSDCESTITIEDKLAPRLLCRDTLVGCGISTLPENLGYPTILDNCEFIDTSKLNYFDLTTQLNCGTLYNGVEVRARITRSWTVIDNNSNVGTCTQSIYLAKENLQDIVFPANRFDESAISCSSDEVNNLEFTGEPTVNGMPLRTGGGCNLFVSHQDQIEEVCPPASYMIIRRWEVTDICATDVRVGIQTIMVVDKDPPVITCPDSFIVSSNQINCGATVILPQATAIDSCSDFTIQPSWEFGQGYGPFSNVPVGVHTVTYTAIDQCGNSSTCTSKLEVIDNSKPVAICRNELHIALTNDGFSEINAAVFDGGSRDNCGVVKWEVARESDALFGDSIRFTCEDIGELISIRFRVLDAVGLSSECSTKVLINDEAEPIITYCPPNITINCSEDANNTLLTGYAQATDNCAIQEIYFEDEADVNSCNIGTITRTWFAIDSAGNNSSCQQFIYLVDDTPITVIFPEDYLSNECGGDLSPSTTGEPIISGDNCENVLVSHVDEAFSISGSACMKILRTWTVLDWCSYNPVDSLDNSRITKVQLIKITDEEAPIITACPTDITVGITDFACETRVDLADVIATDCSTNLTITNTSIYADANGVNASGMYPIGTHTVGFKVSDGCGNESSCEMTITVEDHHAPTAVCKYGLTISLMEGGSVTVPPNAINSGSYDNCSGADGLTYEISPRHFTCDDIGKQTINLIVTDQAGNSQFCTTDIFIQDNGFACTDTVQTTAIGGRIFTEDGNAMEEVPVQLTGGLEEMGHTDEQGSYLFDELSSDETYTVRPMPNEDYREGLSTFDLILIRKHILGIVPLGSPYKMIAADVNDSKTITAFDMVIIRQTVLGTRNDFPENSSWKYIDASYDFPDPRNPFLEEVPQFKDYKHLLINDLQRDFIGVKIGDVNNSASPMAMAGGRSKREALLLEMDDITMKAGFEYRIPFKAKDLADIQGYQFTIDFKPNLLQLKEVISGESISMSQYNFGLTQKALGKITTSWENVGSIRTNDETVLFTLVFEAQQAADLSDAVVVNSSITLAEAYDTSDEVMKVRARFSNQQLSRKSRLFQNRPNPFRDQTIISFQVPISTEGTISIFDINGKLLKSYYGKYAQGYNEVAIDLSEIHTQTGVLYYHLTTPVTKRLSQKMVIIRE